MSARALLLLLLVVGAFAPAAGGEWLELHTVAFTTTSGGAATVYTSAAVNGRVLAIRYDYDDADTGADFTVTGETTGIAIVTVTNAGTSDVTYYPRAQVQDGAAAGVTYDGTNEVYEPVPVANERIKIVVAQGGNVLSGTLYIITD